MVGQAQEFWNWASLTSQRPSFHNHSPSVQPPSRCQGSGDEKNKIFSWLQANDLHLLIQRRIINKWFIVSVHPLSYGCVQEKRKSLKRWEQSITLAFEVLSNFPSAPITRWTHPNHEPNYCFKTLILFFFNNYSPTCFSMTLLHHQGTSIT